MLQLALMSDFTQAVGNSCPPNHNVPWWMWATKLELSHSASHLHCYWLALPFTLLAVVVLPTSATTNNRGNSVIPTDRKAYGTTGNPTTKLLCLYHERILHLTYFLSHEMDPSVTDRRWHLLRNNWRDGFLQWRSAPRLLKKGVCINSSISASMKN